MGVVLVVTLLKIKYRLIIKHFNQEWQACYSDCMSLTYLATLVARHITPALDYTIYLLYHFTEH